MHVTNTNQVLLACAQVSIPVGAMGDCMAALMVAVYQGDIAGADPAQRCACNIIDGICN